MNPRQSTPCVSLSFDRILVDERLKDALDVRADGRDVGVAFRRSRLRLPGGHERDRRAGENNGREYLFHADSIAMSRRPGNDEYANGLRADANGRAIARLELAIACARATVPRVRPWMLVSAAWIGPAILGGVDVVMQKSAVRRRARSPCARSCSRAAIGCSTPSSRPQYSLPHGAGRWRGRTSCGARLCISRSRWCSAPCGPAQALSCGRC